MSVTFKCKQTGNTVTFRDEVDIVGMRQHPEYTEVFPEQTQSYSNQEQEAEQQQQPIVKRGRPSKEK